MSFFLSPKNMHVKKALLYVTKFTVYICSAGFYCSSITNLPDNWMIMLDMYKCIYPIIEGCIVHIHKKNHEILSIGTIFRYNKPAMATLNLFVYFARCVPIECFSLKNINIFSCISSRFSIMVHPWHCSKF